MATSHLPLVETLRYRDVASRAHHVGVDSESTKGTSATPTGGMAWGAIRLIIGGGLSLTGPLCGGVLQVPSLGLHSLDGNLFVPRRKAFPTNRYDAGESDRLTSTCVSPLSPQYVSLGKGAAHHGREQNPTTCADRASSTCCRLPASLFGSASLNAPTS